MLRPWFVPLLHDGNLVDLLTYFSSKLMHPVLSLLPLQDPEVNRAGVAERCKGSKSVPGEPGQDPSSAKGTENFLLTSSQREMRAREVKDGSGVQH